MDGYFTQASSFLISTLVGLYIIIVLMRFLLQWVRADFYNPLCQFLVKATNPLLVPLRRFIPGLYGLDIASLVLAYGLMFIQLSALNLINGHGFPIFALLWVSIGQLLVQILYIFLIAIIALAIISWINPMSHHPAISLLEQLTRPILRPCQRILPTSGGIDFSPLIAIIAINLLIMMIPFIFH